MITQKTIFGYLLFKKGARIRYVYIFSYFKKKMLEILKADKTISRLLLEKIICFDKVKRAAENGICVSFEIIREFLNESKISVKSLAQYKPTLVKYNLGDN